MHVCRPLYSDGGSGFNFLMDSGLSEELLIAVMQLLKKYLMDESVEIIEMASQALRVSHILACKFILHKAYLLK